jgi:hypothetical protein
MNMKSGGRDLGQNSAVYLAVPQPFLSRCSIQMDENLGLPHERLSKG